MADIINDTKPVEPEENVNLKTCPYCSKTIKRRAIVCTSCGRDLPHAVRDISAADSLKSGGKNAVRDETRLQDSEIEKLSALSEDPPPAEIAADDSSAGKPIADGDTGDISGAKPRWLRNALILAGFAVIVGFFIGSNHERFQAAESAKEEFPTPEEWLEQIRPQLEAEEKARAERKAQEEEQKAQDAARKVRLEAELNELRKLVRSKNDEVERIKWIYDKTTPQTFGKNIFYIYLGQKTKLTWPRLVMGFKTDGWVFMDRVIISIDNMSYTISFPFYEVKREVQSDNILEYVDLPADKYPTIIKSIGDGQKVVVRYRGDQYYHDVRLTNSQIAAVKRMYRMYEVYRALDKYP